ncbi:MAG: ATP-binding protein [Candidatus Omnitrophota bacterium]
MLLDPATGNNFYGRTDVLALLEKRSEGLRSGYRQNVAVIGPSYCGKTSLLYRFISLHVRKDLVPVYIEVKDKGLPAFVEKFSSTLIYRYLDRTEGIQRTSKASKAVEALLKSGKGAKALRAALELPAIAFAETGLKPVVIIDEFDRLGGFGIEDVFAELGKSIMVQKDTMYIVASSRIKQAREILSEKLSLLFGNFEICELGTFGVKEACGFIDSRLTCGNMPPELREFIASFTDGHPFYLDSVLLNMEKRTGLLPQCRHKDELINTFTETLFDSKGILNQHFSVVLTEFEEMDRRMTPVLLALSGGAKKLAELAAASRVKKPEAAALLDKLIDSGRVSKHGVCYLIRDKVFEFWLRNVYHSKEYLFDSGYEPKISRFRESVSGFIDSYVSENSGERARITGELFMSFKGELVELSGKSLKMPHFRSCEVECSKTDGISYIKLSGADSIWVLLFSSRDLRDNHIIDYISHCRKYKDGLKRRIIITAADIGANAKLIAKDAKCLIWGPAELNILMDIAGRHRIVLPVEPENAGAAGEGLMDSETAS